MKRRRLHVFYSGHVQGVGFRYAVKRLSAGYEVTGAVRNLADGRVELAAEGDEQELEAFMEGVRESEVGSLIRGEEAVWTEAQDDFRGFQIV